MVRGSTTIENCYSTFGDQVTTISMDPVSSGELCYNLNNGASEGICWYQTIGLDLHPVLDNSHGTVYKASDNSYYSKNNLKGDVNGDGKVTDADIPPLADYILNPVNPDFPTYRADMNGDNAIDVYDIVAIRNEIDKNTQKDDVFTARMYSANTTIKAGGTRNINVTLSSAQTVTALQADIKFTPMLSASPESVQLGTIKSDSHIIRASQTDDGIRVLAYSPTLEPFVSRTGVAFSFVLNADSAFSGTTDFSLSNIRVTASDGTHAQINDASYTVSFAKTYISSIVFPEPDVEIIQGTSLTLTPKILPVLATNKELNWTTSNASVASVDQQGNVVTGDMGDAVITATATDGSRISGSVNVHVVEDPQVGVLSLHSLPADAEIFSVTGVRLQRVTRSGVYIVNGKKVLVK